MPNSIAQLPLGDVQFFDNDVPGADAGNYWITVTHALTEGGKSLTGSEALQAQQEMVVSAPQFSLDGSEIVSVHPAAGSSGLFAQQLPHIVFRESALPWERKMSDAPQREPWLALLVFTADELLDAPGSQTRSSSTTVAAFLDTKSDPLVLKPAVVREDDVPLESGCTYVRISTDVFTRVVPRREELRFLAHTRRANIGDKAAQQLDPDGFFAIVFANRFPAAPPAGTPATKNIVHLVSLEGLDGLLVEKPDFQGRTSVALLSLASWSFQCLPQLNESFRGLAQAIVGTETTIETRNGTKALVYHPENLWLRLPAPANLPASDVATEVAARIGEGFVPLAYHTRTGEDTFAWYRGPLSPVQNGTVTKTVPFYSADAAIAYQPKFGVFDMTLAAAWEAGRAAALSDRAFGQSLLTLRREAHLVLDRLVARLQLGYTPDQIASLRHDTTVQDEFLTVLDADLLAAIGKKNTQPVAIPPPAAGTPPPDPKQAVHAFFSDAAVQAKVAQLVHERMAPVAAWLARLMLLYPLPFELLVPDPRMLPVESLRFFYVDTNWTGALTDGALSIGLESSRHTFYQETTMGMLQRAAFDAAKTYRATLIGVEPPAAEAQANVMSGLLLRSALVSSWPSLAVRPTFAGKAPAKILRMDHVSPTTLLCLFWGVPDLVEIAEPQEGFRHGVDDDGRVTLRIVNEGDAKLGTQIGAPFPFYQSDRSPSFVREPGTRVLDVAAALRGVRTALTATPSGDPGELTPATFAMQMIKSPEAIVFASRPAPV